MNAHRKRRIAADEAHSWARNLRLRNPYAKLVLSMLSLYVDGAGTCFVGIEALAEDTELSTDTVRKRLAWLEGIGAIARFPQWIDANGRRNSEERGKRTTDEIRLLMASDPELIEARAIGEDIPESEAAAMQSSPSHQQGPSQGAPGAGPGLALGQPSDSGKGLDSSNLEPEPEDSPQPPEAGGCRPAVEESEGQANVWAHAESWQRVETAWGDPILHQGTCRNIWEAFTEDERERFIRVIRGYLAHRLRQPKLPNRVNLQKLMRERDAWPGYEKLAGPDPSLRTFIAEGSVEHRALQVIARIGGWADRPTSFDDVAGKRGYWRATGLRPDELAMATLSDKPVEQWASLERATKPFFAWSDRLHEWTGQRRETIRVPLLFPPRVDGTFPTSTDPPQHPPP